MTHESLFRNRMLALCAALALFAGCGWQRPASPPATSLPSAVPTVAPATPQAATAPQPTSTPMALSAEDSLLATIAAGITPTSVNTTPQPTAMPTITLGPTAMAQPLAAGWWDNAVCYEIFVRSFRDSDGDGVGDLRGVTEKLDYINDGDPSTSSDLGATCIWLMPISESSSYHGYDTVDYYSVERDYGSNDDFKQLVAAAHTRGIHVIMDLVLNHTSSQHPWFLDALNNPNSPYRDWYIWSANNPGYLGPWGEQVWHPSPRGDYYYGIFVAGMPDLNYRNPAVSAEARKISAFWLNDMGVDGFRLDAIKHVVESGREQENTRETHAWLRAYAADLRSIKPEVFTVGEVFDGRTDVLASYYPDQLDTFFEFGVSNALLDAARTGDGAGLTAALTRAATQLPFQRWAPFLSNHDQTRTMSALAGNRDRARVAATALLTLPGLPFIFYGEEIGMQGDKPDERIRTPMQWNGEQQAGFTDGQPWEALQGDVAQVNVVAQDADPASLLNEYRQMIRLHSSTPALAQGTFTPLTIAGNPAVSVFVRQAGDSAVLVVLNFGEQPLAAMTIGSSASDLAPGQYQLRPLHGSAGTGALTVGEGGSISAITLPQVTPLTGAVFAIQP